VTASTAPYPSPESIRRDDDLSKADGNRNGVTNDDHGEDVTDDNHDGVILQGYLGKRETGLFHEWHQRWFQLRPNSLIYFKLKPPAGWKLPSSSSATGSSTQQTAAHKDSSDEEEEESTGGTTSRQRSTSGTSSTSTQSATASTTSRWSARRKRITSSSSSHTSPSSPLSVSSPTVFKPVKLKDATLRVVDHNTKKNSFVFEIHRHKKKSLTLSAPSREEFLQWSRAISKYVLYDTSFPTELK